jgi:hypothetical protein
MRVFGRRVISGANTPAIEVQLSDTIHDLKVKIHGVERYGSFVRLTEIKETQSLSEVFLRNRSGYSLMAQNSKTSAHYRTTVFQTGQ